jgi:hypothetical protein
VKLSPDRHPADRGGVEVCASNDVVGLVPGRAVRAALRRRRMVRRHRHVSLLKVPLNPGVDVMITIFYEFCQFSAKKLAFFLKTNAMIKFLIII